MSEYAGKGRRKRKRDKTNKVTNDDQEREFKMKSKENWLDNFRGQLHGDKPFWDQNKKMCTRWHIRGDCFKDCQSKASHVGKDKIPGDKKEAMKKYIKKVRRT